MDTIYLAFAALAVASLGLAVLERTIARTTVGTGIVIAILVVEISGVLIPSLNAGSFNLWLLDLPTMLIVVAAVARGLRSTFTPVHYAVLTLCGLGVVSLVRGVLAFGPEAAVNEARPWLLFLGVLVYCMSGTHDETDGLAIASQIRAAGIVLAAVACLRWASQATGVPIGPLTPTSDSLRILGADAAFVTGQAFLLMMPAWRQHSRATLYLTSAFLLGVTVLLQHRTVWIAIVVTLVVLAWRDPSLARRLGTFIVVAVFVAIGVAIAVLGSNSQQLDQQATNSRTFAWRLQGWAELVIESGPSNMIDVAAGVPFGAGWERRVDGETRDETPHNQYVEVLLRLGVIGGAIFIGVHLYLLRLLIRREALEITSPFDGRLAAYLLTFQMMFGITYIALATGAIVLGMSLSSRRDVRTSTTDVPGDVPMLRPVS